MSRRFNGRPVLAGSVCGEALVTHQGFNSLASFYPAMLGNSAEAICADHGNPDLFGKLLSGNILCLPKTIGSTSAGTTWDRVAKMGIAPLALLLSETIDSLAAAGLIVADEWAGTRIVAVDRLGQAFLDHVRDGDTISVCKDGTVIVHDQQKV
jgi:predicted aconitase with swiveling domain